MAMFVRCPECGKRYFSNSTNCPECGALNRELENMERKAHPYDFDDRYASAEEKRRVEEHDHIKPYENLFKNDSTYNEKAKRKPPQAPRRSSPAGNSSAASKLVIGIIIFVFLINFIIPAVVSFMGEFLFDNIVSMIEDIPGISELEPEYRSCPEGYILEGLSCVAPDKEDFELSVEDQTAYDKFIEDTWYIGYIYDAKTEEEKSISEYWMLGLLAFDKGDMYILSDSDSNLIEADWQQSGNTFEIFVDKEKYAKATLDMEQGILVLEFVDNNDIVLLVQDSYYDGLD